MTLAVALSKYPDIEVQVFKAAKQFTEVGADVGIWPRVFKSPYRCLVPSFRYRKRDQPDGVELFQLVTKGGLMKFHRADFHGVLLSYLSPS
ncbi:hypothetical protein V8E55_002763 [Tylopilus felleus]